MVLTLSYLTPNDFQFDWIPKRTPRWSRSTPVTLPSEQMYRIQDVAKRLGMSDWTLAPARLTASHLQPSAGSGSITQHAPNPGVRVNPRVAGSRSNVDRARG